MVGINLPLLKLARFKLAKEFEKAAVVPAAPPGGGAPPGGPGGGAPPGMGGPPGAGAPMDPSMMGGAPPGGAAPPGMGGPPPLPPSPDGSVMGMAAQTMAGQPMTQPMAGQAPAGPAAPPKMKPEQYMQMLDQRMYNLQQQITAMLNAQGVKLDPSVLTLPPNSGFVQPEQAIQGQAMDPGAGAAPDQGGGGGGGQPQSAIQPIDPMQGAFPSGGGGAKAAANLAEQYANAVAQAVSQPFIPKTAAELFGAGMALLPAKIRALRQLGIVK